MSNPPSPLPTNVRAISDWIRKNRPGILREWNVIVREGNAGRHPRFQGMMGLALIAFDAGRDYQRDHSCEGGTWDTRHLPQDVADA